ncbi:MAG: DUF3078 domain-containing protein [Bacteroides sp.]|jgi:hypothetical protein|nr:DUF3078 domain-containing protein [Bacteroides sp.]
MKKILFAILFLSALSLSAQEDTTLVRPWALNGFFSQQLNQVSFTNWAAGGENSFASTSIAVLTANYSKEKTTWENKLDLAYGLIKTQDTPTRKNEDKIDLLSKYGHKVSPKIAATALLNFRSQFTAGYNYPDDEEVVSNFLAPGYLLASLGFDYKPVDYLSIFFSPATGKFTFVNDETLSAIGAYGVEPGKTFRPEFGAMASFTFAKDIFENVNLASKLDLFNNYTDSNKPNRKNTDVNWQTNLNMKVNKFITASMGFNLIYDHDIPVPIFDTVGGEEVQVGTGPRTQFKQIFGIGLSYNFKRE